MDWVEVGHIIYIIMCRRYVSHLSLFLATPYPNKKKEVINRFPFSMASSLQPK